jgi:hypothetical protein
MADTPASSPQQEGSSSSSQLTLSEEIQSLIDDKVAKAIASSMGGKMSPETKTQDDQMLEDDVTKSKSDGIPKSSELRSMQMDNENTHMPQVMHKHNDTLSFEDSIYQLIYELMLMHPLGNFSTVIESPNRFIKVLSKDEQGEKIPMVKLLPHARNKTFERFGGTESDRRYVIDNSNLYRGLTSAFGHCKSAANAIKTAEIGNGHMLYNYLKTAIVPPEKGSIIKIMTEAFTMIRGEKESITSLQQRLYYHLPAYEDFIRKSDGKDLWKLLFATQAVNVPDLRCKYTAEEILKKEIGDLVQDAIHITQSKHNSGISTSRPNEINAVRFDRTNRSRSLPSSFCIFCQFL